MNDQIGYLLSIIGDKEVLIYQLRQHIAELGEQLDNLKKDNAEKAPERPVLVPAPGTR